MPSSLFATTEKDRSFAYTAVWIGLPASLLLLASLIFGFDRLAVLAGGVTSGTLIGLALSWSLEEYAKAQLGVAAKWALALAGVLLIASLLKPSRLADMDSATALSMIAAAFHVALAAVRLRGA